ncbi:MAG: glycosyltransferase family 2 protein [Candidatus Coatesbacteria bacterium]|nr:glycosyltransferase family 2 protein [Candidatus Coatesbacteria bacterium]
MTDSDREISFVLRVCDTESGLSATVRAIDEIASQLCERFEILIVDDGSEKETAEECRILDSELNSVRLMKLPFTIGYSSGIKSALTHSQYPWVMSVPAEGSFVPADITRFVQKMGDYDLVVGYRPLSNRSFGNKIWISLTRIILRVLFGISVRETNSAKLFRKDKLQNMIIESRGFAIGAELIIKSMLKGARLCHVLLSDSPIPERKTDTRNAINILVGALELMLFFVMRTFRLADFDPTGEDRKRVLR